ncbi:MAG: hypothetical protein IJ796_01750 [Lachnospiraceae bacterium]|nr:hypothetical protein [Lachnospiraceae bacterium]
MAVNKSPIIVQGYAFYNDQDAVLAEAERKKVEYLHTHLNTSDPEKVLAVYSKAVSDRMFKTPIGIDFLREMQTYLIEQCDYAPTDVPAIPLFVEYDKQLKDREVTDHRRIAGKKKEEEPKEKVPFIFISVVFNIALIAAVIAMFVITLKSDQPNILNYETAIRNQYSYWEQELTEKEHALRVKENELKQREIELELKNGN